jgi:hypothetical protein
MTRPPERPDHRHIRHTALARVRRQALTAARALGLPLTLGALLALALSALLAALSASPAPAAAEAAPALEWSKPKVFDSGRTPSAVSCASESLCVAVDHKGDALSTSDPRRIGPRRVRERGLVRPRRPVRGGRRPRGRVRERRSGRVRMVTSDVGP